VNLKRKKATNYNVNKVCSVLILMCFGAFLLLPQMVSVAVAGNDDYSYEVGVEWVETYHGIASDLAWTSEEAEGFYNRLGQLSPPTRIKIEAYPTTDYYVRSHGLSIDEPLPDNWWTLSGYEFKVTGSAFTYETTKYLTAGAHYVEYAASGYVPNYAWHAKIYINDVLRAEGDVGRFTHLRADFNTAWSKSFDWGNDLAWESDFENSAVGGYDYVWIDAVDFAYFSGHGYYDAFWFGTDYDGDGTYPNRVHYSEVDWGDLDLDWISISACLILNYQPSGYPTAFDRWGWPVFRGLHAILSFDTVSYDTPIWILWPFWWESPGERFVNYMTTPYTIGNSWERMTQDWQPSDVWGAALAVWNPSTGYVQWDDYLPGYGYVSPDIDNPTGLAWRRWQC
jgi:hypothetical protein